jgi:xylan 1,4-beta-xylosidase
MNLQRPVIPGFHPDPSVCRVGDTYYAVTSSFEYAPGVPVFRSTDLRSWEQIGHALHRPAQLDVTTAWSSGGIMAPTLRHHDGRFWMITTNMADGGGHVLVWAEDPAGPWSDPVRIPEAPGIDPDLAWDEDGTCYMTYAGFGSGGPQGIVQSVIDLSSGKVLNDPQQLWSGTGGRSPEGPRLYHIGEFWYLLIAEGGTERGHAVTIARGPSPSGPFESCPHNPVLTHRGQASPVQNTGHADLIQRPDGTWAILYHGVRTRGSSPEFHVLGREVFADEVSWVDGWPVLTGHIEPADDAGTVQREVLDGTALPVSWASSNLFPSEIVSPVDGSWRVSASGDRPVFAGRRQEHLYARVRARLTVEGRGGLSLRIDPRHALELECTDGTARAVWAVGGVRHVLGEQPVDGDTEVEIRVMPSEGHPFSTEFGPDRIAVGTRQHGGFVVLGEIDGRYISTEVASGMTGRMIGISCHHGSVLVQDFEYLGADDAGALEHASSAD